MEREMLFFSAYYSIPIGTEEITHVYEAKGMET
jgi:hypothetical protein